MTIELYAGALYLAAFGLYAAYAASRRTAERRRLDEALRSRAERREGLSAEVAQAKARVRGIETEQREVLALYGMVKGLSEALSWEDARPKVEVAVRQYLAVEEFALYVAEAGAEGRLMPLVRRRLGASVGCSWETLERCLQERGLSTRVPHALESPERAVALPIFEEGRMIGYLYARLPPDADPKALLAKAQAFVDEIAFAFKRVMLYQEMELHSQIDGLTGVYRRRMLDEKLAEEVVRAQTFKTSFCLMLLDIDHFKSLNDTYGHQFGDLVLQRVGEILKSSVYETDFVARYGGEEFAILLPRAEPAGVLRKAESVRQAVEGLVFPLASQRVRVTISIGVAHYPRDGQSAEAVVRQADQALYAAKERGRNRVVDIAEARRTQ